jgi:hypothetical protein
MMRLPPKEEGMPKHPLAEVFGFPTDNFSPEAERYRKHKLCPYNNKVPSCTKDKAENPLGVCSVFEGSDRAITCPIRFRQDCSLRRMPPPSSGLRGDFLMTYDDDERVRSLAQRHGFTVQAVAMKNTHHAKMTELLIGRNLEWLQAS